MNNRSDQHTLDSLCMKPKGFWTISTTEKILQLNDESLLRISLILDSNKPCFMIRRHIRFLGKNTLLANVAFNQESLQLFLITQSEHLYVLNSDLNIQCKIHLDLEHRVGSQLRYPDLTSISSEKVIYQERIKDASFILHVNDNAVHFKPIPRSRTREHFCDITFIEMQRRFAAIEKRDLVFHNVLSNGSVKRESVLMEYRRYDNF
eukprot:TRINITY_DN17080_c0_g1_i1.p1 TRINITY_DN17080_c0_g1~~TRINITY_DN17080_c0_g1_i1.p1  ORF type:complete len:206 (-),score=13.86 TRINITY_DN17080_c0_g1_i1:313-930(-)